MTIIDWVDADIRTLPFLDGFYSTLNDCYGDQERITKINHYFTAHIYIDLLLVNSQLHNAYLDEKQNKQ